MLEFPLFLNLFILSIYLCDLPFYFHCKNLSLSHLPLMCVQTVARKIKNLQGFIPVIYNHIVHHQAEQVLSLRIKLIVSVFIK